MIIQEAFSIPADLSPKEALILGVKCVLFEILLKVVAIGCCFV
jgi:hypothetical protein